MSFMSIAKLLVVKTQAKTPHRLSSYEGPWDFLHVGLPQRHAKSLPTDMRPLEVLEEAFS
jgi:hypothetical protein